MQKKKHKPFRVSLFNSESTGYYGAMADWPGESGGEGGGSGWYTCDKGEGFASGDFRLKVCRRVASGGSKGMGVFLERPGGAEECP